VVKCYLSSCPIDVNVQPRLRRMLGIQWFKERGKPEDSSGYEIFNHIGMYLTERKRLSMLYAVYLFKY